MKLSKEQRAQLREKFGGKCAYCGIDLPEKGWHADHVEPILREWWKESHGTRYEVNPKTNKLEKHKILLEPAGAVYPEKDVLDNLFPSCRACNIDKHASSLESWRKQMERRVEVCRRNYSAFRHAERFGLVVEVKKPVVFWFEKYNEIFNLRKFLIREP